MRWALSGAKLYGYWRAATYFQILRYSLLLQVPWLRVQTLTVTMSAVIYLLVSRVVARPGSLSPRLHAPSPPGCMLPPSPPTWCAWAQVRVKRLSSCVFVIFLKHGYLQSYRSKFATKKLSTARWCNFYSSIVAYKVGWVFQVLWPWFPIAALPIRTLR